MKEVYVDATMEVVHFSVSDIILTSSANLHDATASYEVTGEHPTDEDAWRDL